MAFAPSDLIVAIHPQVARSWSRDNALRIKKRGWRHLVPRFWRIACVSTADTSDQMPSD